MLCFLNSFIDKRRILKEKETLKDSSGEPPIYRTLFFDSIITTSCSFFRVMKDRTDEMFTIEVNLFVQGYKEKIKLSVYKHFTTAELSPFAWSPQLSLHLSFFLFKVDFKQLYLQGKTILKRFRIRLPLNCLSFIYTQSKHFYRAYSPVELVLVW